MKRGGQPLYYYLLIQIPIYEYLPAIGAFIAAGFGLTSLWHKIRNWLNRNKELVQEEDEDIELQELPEEENQNFPVMLFLGYWAITALGAYSLAGERMPWLTVHIVLPLIFLAGWGIQKLLQSASFSS